MMEFGINVDSLQNIRSLANKEEKMKSVLLKTEKYKSKIVEYTFFVQNEIEVSEKLNKLGYRFLTIQKHDFVKICEANKVILEKMNINLDSYNNDDNKSNTKKIVLLKYKINNMFPFIDRFFYHNHINNTSLFPDKPRTSLIFWDFINEYECFFNDLLFLADNQVLFLDLSSKNLLYNRKFTIFFEKFDKCLLRKDFGVSKKDIGEDGNLQKLSKYIEIETYIDKFIMIIESIEYYGNKHFDLYFSKQLIKNKNFYSVYKDLDNIIDDYLNNVYYLKNFSDKFKDDNKIKWKSQIKTRIEENIQFLNIIPEKLNWKLYLLMLLENYQYTVWETFSLNSLFLNITYYMIKMFNVQEKSSVIHRYFKFLFKNMDMNCSSFNNSNSNNNINIMTCRDEYNKYRDSFEDKKDYDCLENLLCLSHVTIEQQQELYDLLLNNKYI